MLQHRVLTNCGQARTQLWLKLYLYELYSDNWKLQLSVVLPHCTVFTAKCHSWWVVT